MTVAISLVLQSVVGVSGERPRSASEVNQYLMYCTLVCLLDVFGSIQRHNVALPFDHQSNGFIETHWDYFFSAFLSRSKLFFLPAIASAREKNAVIEEIASRYGQVVDLHAHFLTGDPSWFTATIEPTLRGASEVRRAFLPYVLGKA
jgi:hypothetical protein